MIESRGLTGVDVTIRTGEDCEGPMALEYNGFEIVITSDITGNSICIEGCHDASPSFTERNQ